MQILVGTSGYAFDGWKGTFYPEDAPTESLLRSYAERFDTVEINNTFYRVPKRKVVADWGADVPDGFVFSLKATRRITHQQKLKRTEDLETSIHYVHRSSVELGPKLGANLFQLPPFMKKDVPLIEDFLDAVPKDWPVTLEFRHPSWFDDDVYAALRAKDAAFCVSDSEKISTPMVATAPWGYVRLRRQDYDQAANEDWADRITAQPWERALVYFKHEDGPPEGAVRFKELVASRR